MLYDLVARDNASSQFDRAGRSASTVDRTLTRLGRTAAVAGAAIGAAAVVIADKSVKMATDFQASMEKVHTQAGASQKAVDQLSKSVLNLGKYAEQSPQQLADALFHLKSVGLDNVKAMMALKTASDLAAVGGADLEDTTNALAGAWRSGIKGAQNFGQAAATLNAIVGAGNLRMQDLVAAMGTGFLPTARSFGLSLKSVGAALALMTDEGIPAQQAATRLRMSINLLGAPTKKAAGELASIGLSSTSLANAMRGPQGIVGAISLLKSHLDASGLSATKQAQLLSAAFGGGRSSSAILTLVNNLEVLRKKQDQINATTGRYGGAVAAQRKTAQAQFALLKSSLDVLGVKIGSALLPPLVKFTRFLNNTVLPAAVTVAKGIGRVFRDVVPVDAIKRDWNALLRFIGAAPAPAVPAANGVPQQPRYGRGLTGIHPVGPASPSVIRVGRGLTGIQPTGPASPAPGLVASIGAALSKINWGQVISSAITAAVKDAGKIGAAILGLFGKINWAQLGKQAAYALVPFVISLVNNFAGAVISEAIHHPLDLIAFIIALIPIGRVAGIIGEVLSKIPFLGPLVRLFTKPLEAAGGLVERALGRFLKFVFGPVLRRIEPFFRNAQYWLWSKGVDILDGLAKGAGKAWGVLTGWLGKIGGWILKPFSAAGRWLLSVGGDVIGGLLSGIKNKMLGIGRWILSNVVDPVIHAVKSFFGIHSPSTVMHGIGFQLIAGLVRGIISHNPVSAIKRVFGSLPSALGHLVSKGLVAITSLPGKALRALGGLGSKIGGLFSKLFGGGGGGGPAVSIGKRMAAAVGWTGAQWNALYSLWQQESGWNPNAVNPSSGAYGIPQSLGHGHPYALGDAASQIRWGLSYIAQRYGSPLAAWAHEQQFNWYAKGGTTKPGWAWVGERGPELVRMAGGETVLDAVTSRKLAGYAAGTLTPEQRLGLAVADRYAPANLTTLMAIRKAADATARAIRDFYHGSAARWRIEDVRDRAARLSDVASRLTAVRSRIAAARGYQQSTLSNLSGYAGLDQLTPGGTYTGTPGGGVKLLSGGQYLNVQLKTKLATLRTFSAALRKLTSMHAPSDLLRQIIDLGPDAGLPYAQELIKAGPSVLRQVSKTEAAISGTEARISRGAASAVYEGRYQTRGNFLDQLKDQEAGLTALMRRLGKALGTEAARWLGVSAARLGRRLPKGYASGGTFAAGQLIMTGEHGPELVSFGQPGRVHTAGQTRQMTGARGPLVSIGEAHFHDEADLNVLAQKLSFATVAAGLGA